MIQYFKDVLQQSWLIKGFLALLTLSFGIWGIGDALRPGMDPKIAVSVGKTDIGLADVQDRFSRAYERIRQQMSGMDAGDMKRVILNNTVQEITQQTTMDNATTDMGLVVPDDQVRESIKGAPAFKDETGSFNQMQYQRLLADNNYTERAFLKLYVSDMRRQSLVNAVTKNSAAPMPLVYTLLAYQSENRTADTLLISANALPTPAAPTAEELKKAYDANIATFTQPEYRKIEAVVLRTDDLVSPDSLTEDQLKAFYDENADRYRTHETRHVAQIVFDTKEQADAARTAAAPGDHLEEIAKKAKASVVDLGDVAKNSPLVKTMGAAYDLAPGEVSQPVQSDLGWHLFEVKEVKPEVVRAFDSVKGEIRQALADDKGTDALYDASQKLEDTVSSGTSMQEAAEKVGGKIIAIDAVDRDGKDPHGQDAKGILDNKNFIRAAFALPAGGESKLMEIPKGYYMLRVISITPPTPKPLDDVRKQVTELVEKEKRSAAAKEAADKLAADIKPDTTLQQVAAKDNASFATLGPIDRFGQGAKPGITADSKRISPELLEKLFAAKPGDVVTAPVVDGVVVARLREVNAPEGTDTIGKGITLAAQLQQQIGSDLVDAMGLAFSQRYPVKVNASALDTLVSSNR